MLAALNPPLPRPTVVGETTPYGRPSGRPHSAGTFSVHGWEKRTPCLAVKHGWAAVSVQLCWLQFFNVSGQRTGGSWVGAAKGSMDRFPGTVMSFKTWLYCCCKKGSLHELSVLITQLLNMWLHKFIFGFSHYVNKIPCSGILFFVWIFLFFDPH